MGYAMLIAESPASPIELPTKGSTTFPMKEPVQMPLQASACEIEKITLPQIVSIKQAFFLPQ